MVAFQLTDETLKQIFGYYEASKEQAFVVLPLLGIARYVFALKGGIEDQVSVFKDIVFCTVLLIFFSSFLSFGMELPQMIAKYANLSEVSVNVDPVPGDRFSIILSVVCREATWVCYVIAKAIYYISLLIMVVLAAWIILSLTMTSLSGGLLLFIFVFLFVCLIPTFWTLINLGAKILFDSRDEAWNNGILILSSIAKAALSCICFMKGLYNPFLRNIESAFRTVGSKTLGVASVATGGAGLAVAGVNALGGRPITNKVQTSLSALKQGGAAKVAQTIPTAHKLVRRAGQTTLKSIGAVSPAALEVTKNGLGFFQNRKNMYTLESIPRSSPFWRTVGSPKSFSIRHGSTKPEISSSGLADIPREREQMKAPVKNISPKIPRPQTRANPSGKFQKNQIPQFKNEVPSKRNPLPTKSKNFPMKSKGFFK